MNSKKAKGSLHKMKAARKPAAKRQSSKTSRVLQPTKAIPASSSLKIHHSPKASEQPVRNSSKLNTVLTMLRASEGTTLSAIMKATGWQQHSVRGFLTGVIKKRLGLNLVSTIESDQRVYRLASSERQTG